jgi:hypothetical protein
VQVIRTYRIYPPTCRAMGHPVTPPAARPSPCPRNETASGCRSAPGRTRASLARSCWAKPQQYAAVAARVAVGISILHVQQPDNETMHCYLIEGSHNQVIQRAVCVMQKGSAKLFLKCEAT